MAYNYQRIVIKIGSNVLTQKDGLPDTNRIKHLVEQVASIRKQGVEVVLVSSGAVASGRSLINISDKFDSVATRQLFASIGQVKLINTYAQEFEKYNVLCSQVLVTKEDFRDRVHYLNMKNCLKILLQHHVVPVVNENDVVSVTELMFTDNDELAGLIASMLNANALIVLTNVDGIYDAHPEAEGANVIREINGHAVDFSAFVTADQSQFGRGGMLTKSTMARKVAQLGIAVHIANGIRENILNDVLQDKTPHTYFIPNRSASGKKKWIAHAGNYAKGVVQVNEGARAALTSAKASSLLPVGVINILSGFKKGEIIRLVDENNKPIGLGIAEYGSDKAAGMMGQKNQKALIHYDYLYLEC